MAGDTFVYVLVFCAIFWIIASVNECRSLSGYKFTVYTTELCPRNQAEWNERSSTLNCSGSSYMCFPDEHFTELLEFCYDTNRVHITPSTCMYLSGKNSVLNDYNCSRFRHGCPNSSYFTDEVYKYQSCLSIGKGYFLAEQICFSNPPANNNTDAKCKETCNHLDSTPSDERSDVVWIVVITLLCVIVAICTIFHWINKKPRIRLACALKLNGIDRSTTTLNQDENTTFITKADQNNYAVNTADVPLQTNVAECYQTDRRRVLGKDTSDTSTSTDSGISIYKGLSPLHIACVRGHHDTVRQLINKGADINASDNDGKSPLYLACENGLVNVVKILLDRDADVNLCDNDSASPLFIASQEGHNVIVNLLLNHGADVNNKTKNFKE